MKKILLSLVVMCLILTGCNTEVKPETTAPETEEETRETTTAEEPVVETEEVRPESPATDDAGVAKDYFPSEDDFLARYDGDTEFGELEKWIEYKEENRVQMAQVNPGVTLRTVYELTEDEIKILYEEPLDYRFNLLSKDSNERARTILKGPIEVGTSWTSFDKDYTITSLEEEVQVPGGSFKAILVESVDSKSYFVKGIGLVKEDIEVEDGVIFTQELQSYTTGQPVEVGIELWNLNDDGATISSQPKTMMMKTNDVLREAMSELFQREALFPEGTMIKSLYINERDQELYLDVSERIYEANMGALAESNMVQSIINTLTGYFGKDRLYFWVNNASYESGHLVFDKDELIYRQD